MFDINNHIASISDQQIDAIVKPTIDFFEQTPFYQMTNIPSFNGVGVYALYLKSTDETCYQGALPAMYPIYVGKAVPTGSRQGLTTKVGSQLKNRLAKHRNSITQAENLDENDFLCRFIILQGNATEMISTIESYLIREYNPLWNSYIDGFGINAPGKGRYNQQPSEWDTLHPGRSYVKMLTGEPRDKDIIMEKVVNYSVKK
ncbi:Eco29kI family restriction endonuclease [Vibrio sp. Of7-15]|uniref:Eco29kI family restriction endonuclease n=1 Tax=Vibrio sp. Of7-15 TaxID=2724879 RepID=UPI001EF1ADC2|nr:Eco29kI family restriction endonuclease [Vibrio sp. Of7-15]MCG7499167.1 Eco29kI family restriction endonuclease [Vibrio sp. Of7-15]